MIINNAVSKVEMGGIGETKNFNITTDNVKIYTLFSDTTYKDKILAVVREYIQNAWDENQTDPMCIHLPNTLEPWFSVRDFGPGLREEVIHKLYCTYGLSDKDKTNLKIGGLGIGCKAAFAYTDMFTVTSYIDGEKKCYTACFDKVDPPTISLGSCSNTTEPNGLEITVPVKPEDFETFREKTEYILKRFVFKPHVIGNKNFTHSDFTYSVSGKGWGIRENDKPQFQTHYRPSDNKIYATMGVMAYPIDPVQFNKIDKELHILLKLPLDIEFDIGDLSVALSREELSYNKPTIAAIEKRLKEIKDELQIEISKKFEKCKTLYEAKCTLVDMCASTGSKNYNWTSLIRSVATWNNTQISDDTVSYSYLDIVSSNTNINGDAPLDELAYSFSFASVSPYDMNLKTLNLGRKWDNSVRLTCGKNRVFVVDDVGRGVARILQHNYTQKMRNGEVEYLCVIKKNNNSPHASWDAMWTQLGRPPYILASSLEVPPKAPRSTPNRSVAKMVTWCGRDFGYRRAWTEVEVDFSKTPNGIYVPLHRWYPVDISCVPTYRNLLNVAEKYNIIPKDTVVYGVPGTYIKRIQKQKGWKNFFDIMKKNVPPVIEANKFGLNTAYTMEEVCHSIQGEKLVYELAKLCDVIKNKTTPLYKHLKIIDYYKNNNNHNYNSLLSAARFLNIKVTPELLPDIDINQMREALKFKEYPLISMINSMNVKVRYFSYVDIKKDQHKYIIEYINFIDQKGK